MGTNRFHSLTLCILSVLAAVGCGTGMMPPGPDGSSDPDAAVTVDGGNPPPDAIVTPDVQMTPDVQTPPDTMGGACMAEDPTCIGTATCQCDESTTVMPDLCTASSDMMARCEQLMSCSAPHGNRCSVHLLPNQDATPFACETQLRHGNWCYNGACTGRPDSINVVNNIITFNWASVGASPVVAQCSGHECWGYAGLATIMLPTGVPFTHWTWSSDCTMVYIDDYVAGTDPLHLPARSNGSYTITLDSLRP